MFGKMEALSARLPAIATLLVPLSLLGQGCENRPGGRPLKPAGPRAPAPPNAGAPVHEEAPASGASRGTPRPVDRPAASHERIPEPVEAIDVTDRGFAEFTANGVALVDFWAPGCHQCRLQGPIVDRLAERFEGRAALGTLRVDVNVEVPGRFQVTYVPAIIIFRDGREVKRFGGLTKEATLASALEAALRAE